VHDYKTGGYLPPRSRLESDRQLALYQMGIEQSYSDVREVELVWHYLNFNRTIRLRRSADDQAALRRETIGLIEQIQGAREFPARPSTLCQWCEFREICPAGRGDTLGEEADPPTLAAIPAIPPALPRGQLSLL
jgi:putative RecB family exonuclease